MTVTLDDLAGPADADMFRMTVGWGRFYFDPLPTCTIVEATEDQWPAYSYVKKAAEKDWSFLVVNRMSAIESAELHRIAGLDRTQRLDAFRSHEKFAKNIAFGRGTITHLWGEDLGAGRECREITDGWLAANGYPTAARTEAELYKRAMQDFFQTYQPELVAAEYVTIHRTLNGKGYGATPDGLFRIDGGVYGIDWKTRGESTQHAAYPEEAAQIACGARAEYMIVRVDDHAERRLMPQIDGGYVVSIRPDGARLYPVDIPKAWDHWTHLHEWWVHKLKEKDSIGRVKAKRSQPMETTCPPETTNSDASSMNTSSPTPTRKITTATTTGSGASSPDRTSSASSKTTDWRLEAKRRYSSWSTDEQLTYTDRKRTIDTGDPAAVFALMDEIDRFNVSVELYSNIENRYSNIKIQPFPDEGGTVEAADVEALHKRFDALGTEAQLWTGMLVAQGKATHPFHIKGRPSVRRYELYRGILTIAEWVKWEGEAE